MPMPSISASAPGNNKPAGFQAVYIKDTTLEKYQTLGVIRNGELEFTDFSEPTSLGQNKSAGSVGFTAKCQMLQTTVTELELIDSIVNGTNGFLFKMSDAGAIPTDAAAVTTGWFVLTADQVNCKAKYVNSGTPKDTQYIELEWSGSLLLSEKDAALKASIDDDYFASSADTTGVFQEIGTYTAAKDGGSPKPANTKSCGLSTVVLSATTPVSTATLSPLTNVKMEFDFTGDKDDLLRYIPHCVDVNIEYEWTDTSAANLLNLTSMVDLDIKAVITTLDSKVFTLTNVVGIETSFKSMGDYDKNRGVVFTHKGKMLISSFDGTVA